MKIRHTTDTRTGAKQLADTSPVYRKVRDAWLQHIGGWPS